tara:strand:- start:4518 stop:4883 length:366 start_codon:yes stop_codon:yes gene_type:complete
MSQTTREAVRRYNLVRSDPGYRDTMCVRPDGAYVRAADYDALMAEKEAAEARVKVRDGECQAKAIIIADLEARVAELERALATMIYEATHLSPEEDDGSHWAKIAREVLAQARAALAQKGE